MRSGKKQKETRFKTLSKYFLDLSKLVFGGIVLAGVMDLKLNVLTLLITGAIGVFIFAYIGFLLLRLSKSKKK